MKPSKIMQKASMEIDSAELLYCGYCTNNEKYMFRGYRSKKTVFPAGVMLLHHRTKGYILCDTGYSFDKKQLKGIVPFFYEKINPSTVCESDTVAYQLEKRGISTDDIKTVILTHLHLDHIGGLKAFEKADIILSSTAYDESRNPKFRSLVFKQLLPKDMHERVHPVVFSNTDDESWLFGLPTCDLFGDGSLTAVLMEGHARGQMGLFINGANILFCADACWKNEYSGNDEKMRFFAKLIQYDFKAYKSTLQAIDRIKASGIRVIYSHDNKLEKGDLI